MRRQCTTENAGQSNISIAISMDTTHLSAQIKPAVGDVLRHMPRQRETERTRSATKRIRISVQYAGEDIQHGVKNANIGNKSMSASE